MRVSVFSVEGKEKTLSYAFVNGAGAISRYWWLALVKAWFRSRYVDHRFEKVKMFLSKMLIHSNYDKLRRYMMKQSKKRPGRRWAIFKNFLADFIRGYSDVEIILEEIFDMTQKHLESQEKKFKEMRKMLEKMEA